MTELQEAIQFFCGPEIDLLPLPSDDVAPYQPLTPSRQHRLRRLKTLAAITNPPPDRIQIVITDARGLLTRTLTKKALDARRRILRPEDEIDRDDLARWLDLAGYDRSPVVEDIGTYAVRGGIVDVFSPAHDAPTRIDLFGDIVESLRRIDPETQRGRTRIDHVELVLAREVVLDEHSISVARPLLRHQASELGISGPQVRAILAELDDGIRPLGVEQWMPAFWEELTTLDGLCGNDTCWVFDDDEAVIDAAESFLDEAQVQFEEAEKQRRLALPPTARFVSIQRLPKPNIRLSQLATIEALSHAVQVDLPGEPHTVLRTSLEAKRGEDNALAPLLSAMHRWKLENYAIIAVGQSAGHCERLRSILANQEVTVQSGADIDLSDLTKLRTTADVHIAQGGLQRGFILPAAGLVLLGTEDILPQRRRIATKTTAPRTEFTLNSFRDLQPGALVVHTDHGVGRYEGLVKLEAGDVAGDYLKLQYRGEDLLYVPVYKLDRVQRYAADTQSNAGLAKLGGVSWERVRKRAQKAAEDMAGVLVKVQAERDARTREPYAPADEYYDSFESAFRWDETRDQLRAIQDIHSDLERDRPMDRLICGDVGYGKTEVAMRAAFRAVLEQRQVAVLVPTTILAEQHRLSFQERFAEYPITITSLSRFRTRKEERKILDGLRTGRVDIVIGTHRLLQKDIEFKNLGMLIIDEEHRFGVRHKERIKQMKAMVDVLTMTATPIPRTLNMALSGLRDMSIIATPPTQRLAVRTFVTRPSNEVITEAIRQELERGGQIYVVHNRVQTIDRMAERIRSLVPGIRVLTGHGQMSEGELEKVMLQFMAGEAHVLVCTTIIESGLDIPRANTMLVDRADMFGLAQLYQLRGRVGRSDRRAYCYLMIPSPSSLTEIAKKRVSALQRFSELGAGFQLATLDLEIRGAGNLLGSKQSGHVKEVGLELFSEMLADAVAKLQGQPQDAKPIQCEMKVGIPAYLPESYVPDENERLFFYKRIASARSAEELQDSMEDMADRCGPPPLEAISLFDITGLKIFIQPLGVKSFTYNNGGLVLGLDQNSPLIGQPLVDLVQQPRAKWKLTPQVEVVRQVTRKDWDLGLQTAWLAVQELQAFLKQYTGRISKPITTTDN
jgi:transcription-repair coupling factor (superfamily II helicase)